MAGWLTFEAILAASQVSSVSRGNMARVCRAEMCVCSDRGAPHDSLLRDSFLSFSDFFSPAQMEEAISVLPPVTARCYCLFCCFCNSVLLFFA